MKIIFLDIDGVVNTDRQIRINNLEQIDTIRFDTKAMGNLKEIIEKTKCNIVISSTWRIHKKDNGYLWKEIIKNFQSNDIEPNMIVDVTPVIDEYIKPETREKEILQWLNENGNIEKFIILDDQWSMGDLNTHFVRCQPFSGITEEIAEKVIKELNKSHQ